MGHIAFYTLQACLRSLNTLKAGLIHTLHLILFKLVLPSIHMIFRLYDTFILSRKKGVK